MMEDAFCMAYSGGREMRSVALVMGVMALFVAASEAGVTAKILTFQELMRPDVFPNPQYGMKVDSVEEDAGTVSITTTGAVVTINAG